MYVYSKIMLYKNEQILVYDGDLNKGFEAALKKSKKLVLSMAIAGAAFASTSAPKRQSDRLFGLLHETVVSG